MLETNKPESGSAKPPKCIKPSFPGKRHFVACWGFAFTGIVNLHRTTLSVGMVAMVNHTEIHETQVQNNSTISCPADFETQDLSNTVNGEFDWNSQIQGDILGVTFASYVIGNLFAGRIAEIWGAKRTLVCGNFFSSLFTVIAPVCARWNVYAFLVDQFARGLAQGFIVPPFYVVMANWFPRRERGLLSSVAMSGYAVGGVLGGIVTGWLCDIPVLGWSSAFYITGGFNAFLCIMFILVFYEMPLQHPSISTEELDYITEDQETVLTQHRPPVPWKKILRSVPVLALIIGMFGLYWSNSHFLTLHPTYMGSVLKYSMTNNGLVSSLPLLAMSVGTIFSGLISGWMTKRDILTVNNLRKCCCSICAIGFSFSLMGVILAGCDKLTNLVCFTTALFFSGIGFSGSMIASGDMSPTFSGSLFGFTSAVSTTASTVMPVIAGAMTKEETLEQWHHVFYMHITIVLFGSLIFHIFGSAELQEWNSSDSKEISSPPTS